MLVVLWDELVLGVHRGEGRYGFLGNTSCQRGAFCLDSGEQSNANKEGTTGGSYRGVGDRSGSSR